MRIILYTLFVLLPSLVLAQNSKNYMTIDLQNSLQFLLNDSWDVENAKSVNNAIRVSLKSQNKSCHIYSKVYSITGNTSTPLTPGYFKIKFNSTTAPNGHIQYLNSQDITLSYTDQLLVQQKKNNNVRYYYYDFKLEPLGYDFNPGNYGFTILFTMSQP